MEIFDGSANKIEFNLTIGPAKALKHPCPFLGFRIWGRCSDWSALAPAIKNVSCLTSSSSPFCFLLTCEYLKSLSASFTEGAWAADDIMANSEKVTVDRTYFEALLRR